MTIDINELRRLAQAAMTGPDGVSLNWVKLLQDFQKEAGPATINDLLDRLEAAESARRDDYQNWMTALDRNAELLAKLEAAEAERDALRAKIEPMERQEPVATIHINSITGNPSVHFIPGHRYLHHNDHLYALPGAQTQGEWK